MHSNVLNMSPFKDPSLPPFEPHITLIGGIDVCRCCKLEDLDCVGDTGIDVDADAATIVLHRLQSAFSGFGFLSCEFDESQGVSATFTDDGTVKWNQACISVVKRTDRFMKAMEIADEALFHTSTLNAERHFRPPILEPHYSFAYTDDPTVANDIIQIAQCPTSFTCTKISMWWTDPPSINGVINKEWVFVGDIYLDK